MDLEKEQSIKNKLETIKIQEETYDIRIRQLKSLINQMNLRLLENPNEKEKILGLQKLGYEAILYVLEDDKEIDILEKEQQKERTENLIQIVAEEIKSIS